MTPYGDYIKQNTKNLNFFWNGYLEAKNQSIFTPYITAGIGYSRLMVGVAYGSSVISGKWAYPGKSSNNFAWNAGIGSKIKLSEAFDFDIATRYVGLGNIRFGNSVGTMPAIPGDPVRIGNLEVSMGLSYNF